MVETYNATILQMMNTDVEYYKYRTRRDGKL